MQIESTALEGVIVLIPKRFSDDRGFFSETWNRRTMEEAGLHLDFVQDNHSLSRPKGTIRGLHFQSPPHAQDKLVRCTRGRIYDVAVDVRKGSATYGQWVGEELSHDNGRQLLVPAGFLHGFMTLEDDSEVAYKCTDFYAPECDGGVLWNSCGIEWPEIADQPLLSAKDASAPSFADFDSPFFI